MAREILLSEDHNTVEVTHATERGLSPNQFDPQNANSVICVCTTQGTNEFPFSKPIILIKTLCRIAGGLSISSMNKNQPGGAPPDKPGLAKEKGGKEGTEVIEGAFKLPTCHVTVQTQTLVELAYQTLTGATQADETG